MEELFDEMEHVGARREHSGYTIDLCVWRSVEAADITDGVFAKVKFSQNIFIACTELFCIISFLSISKHSLITDTISSFRKRTSSSRSRQSSDGSFDGFHPESSVSL